MAYALVAMTMTFSEPALALAPGYNCIDGTIVAMIGGLTMIYKDERPGQKKLHAVTTTGLGESWTKSTAPILERDWVEGPTVLKVGDVWLLLLSSLPDHVDYI